MDIVQLSALSGALSVSRNLLQLPILAAFGDTLTALTGGNPQAFCSAYARFTALTLTEGPLGPALDRALWWDENPLTECVRTGQTPAAPLRAAGDADLRILQELASLTPALLLERATRHFAAYAPALACLPAFAAAPMALHTANDLLTLYQTQGFGYFARGSAFVLENGDVRPIPPATVRLADLKGYQWQKEAVLKNTLSFLRGEKANNILLYGDKGCGKSSTIQAVCNQLASQGLKIIAFPSREVASFGKVYPRLAHSPFRFILFMDDLTFDGETGEYMALKAFMEGGMNEKTANTLVYATSNRRHLIKETFSDRQGDDVNVRETRDTLTSLADRFGLAIPFSVPAKQEYLAIVDALAAEQGVTLPADQLHRQAEAFALQKNGRSPRTAQQFLHSLRAEGAPEKGE